VPPPAITSLPVHTDTEGLDDLFGVTNSNHQVILTLRITANHLRLTPGSNNIDRLLNVIDKKLTRRLHGSQNLEAATYRIGWLESQLQDREKEVKLLTDSQHKAGWWARFSSWFSKAQ